MYWRAAVALIQREDEKIYTFMATCTYTLMAVVYSHCCSARMRKMVKEEPPLR
jgi:hypothetical protein